MIFALVCQIGINPSERVNRDTVFRHYTPDVARTPWGLVAAWNDTREGRINPYAAVYSGDTWSGDYDAAGLDANCGTVSLAAGGDTVMATWHSFGSDKDIYASLSTDRGLTWTSLGRVNRTDTVPIHNLSRAAFDPQRHRFYVVYSAGPLDRRDVFFQAWEGSWSQEVRLSSPDYYQDWPHISVSPEGVIYAAWHRISYSLPYAVLVCRSTDGGASWSSPVPVAPSANYSRLYPNILAISSHRVLLAYTGDDGEDFAGDIYLCLSTDGGASWTAPARLNQDPLGAVQQFPQMALAGEWVLVVWEDARGSAWSVYGRVVDTFGVPLTDEFLITDLPEVDQRRPKVAPLGPGQWAVVWQDSREDSVDIYWAQVLYTPSGVRVTSGRPLKGGGYDLLGRPSGPGLGVRLGEGGPRIPLPGPPR